MKVAGFDIAFGERLSCFVGCEGADDFCEVVKAYKDLMRVSKEIRAQECSFGQYFAQAVKSLKRVIDKFDGKSELLDFPADVNMSINDAIDGIRRLISKANEAVNGVNIQKLNCPKCVIEIFSRFNSILPGIDKHGDVVFTLESLRKIRQLSYDATLGPMFNFVCRYRREVEEFRGKLKQSREGIDAFNEWIHDMGHYLVQIDKMLPNRSESNLRILHSDVLTLDGLFSGVRVLKIGLQMSLRGDDIMLPIRDEERKHPYEPYKVFHKFRYCFDDKKIIWKDGESKFWGKVAAVGGIEFVAMNLYSNAVKYLSRFRGEKTISTFFKQLKDGLEIRVESYGPLIADDEFAKISHQVYRASSAASYKGSGRGLMRVRKICEAAGYEFGVYTRKEKEKDGFAPFIARIFIPKKYQVQ